MEDAFTKIYQTKPWGDNNKIGYSGSSGPGSRVLNNITYIPFLKKLVKDLKIESIVDIGCGDFQCGHLLYDDVDVTYIGYDTYKDVVLYNSNKYTKPKYTFVHSDVYTNRDQVASGDLCILKDVLQHWRLNHIYTFMDYIIEKKLFKHILLINCENQLSDDTDIHEIGAFRPLSCDYLPLKKYNPKKLVKYHTKEVSLISNVDNLKTDRFSIWYIFGLWDNEMPDIMKLIQKHNAQMCPTFEFALFDKTDIRREMGNAIWDTLDTNVKRKVVLADIARYYLMWKKGGFYLDTDVRVNRDLQGIVNYCNETGKHVLLFTEHDRADPMRMGPRENKAHTHRIYNCMFWSKPNEVFWKQCYDLAMARVDSLKNVEVWTDIDILWASGPDVVTTVFHSTQDKTQIQTIDYKNTQTLLTHLQTGTWRRNSDFIHSTIPSGNNNIRFHI